MNLIARAVILVLLGLSAYAVATSLRHFRGDLIMYPLPAPNERLPRAHALALESSMRQGLKLNPLSWQGHVQAAGYLTVQQKYEAALTELDQAMQYNKAMSAMFLQATIYAEMRRYEEAATAFEKLYRLSVVDRTVLQHLMRLYSERPATTEGNRELYELSKETDMRWPGTFDAYVGLANAHIADPEMTSYLPIILKYFVLASLMPQEGYNRPEPRAYELAHVLDRIKIASRYVGYSSHWAQVEEAAPPR